MRGYPDLVAHPYPMADHGLFIAGDHPLNRAQGQAAADRGAERDGVGSLESIAQGFQQAVAIRNSHRPKRRW